MSGIAVIPHSDTADPLARFLTVNICEERKDLWLRQPVRCAISRALLARERTDGV